MSNWAGAVIILAGLAVAIYFWLGARRKKRRFIRLAGRIDRLQRGCTPEQANEVLRQIYDIIQVNIATANIVVVDQAIAILFAAFDAGIIRQTEAATLRAVIIQAVRAKQPDVAAAALEAFRHMLLRVKPDRMAASVEQLGSVAAVAMKVQQKFLAVKTADIIFELLARPDADPEPDVISACLQTVKIIGILALRRRDGDLFRDLTERLTAISAPKQGIGVLSAEIVSLTTVWLHRIVQNNEAALFPLVVDCVSELADKNLLTDSDLPTLIVEWQGLAGTASLNPGSVLAAEIIELTLKTTLVRGVSKNWDLAVSGAAQLAKMTVSRQGLKVAFPLVLPLLNAGRELLGMELKVSSAENGASFRQQSLYRIVRECLAIVDFVVRRDMLVTPADVIDDLHHFWQDDNHHYSPKSIKRFCQLLLVYWLRNSRQARKVAVSDDLALPSMLSETDKQRLGFLA